MPRKIDREHVLQTHIRAFVRDAVAVDHEFLAFDRSAPRGQFSHMREKARGVRAGTPDTLLRVAGLPNLWWECKWGDNEPTPAQVDMGQRLHRLGDYWDWGTTVMEYRAFLVRCGVSLRANAEFLAMHADAAVASVIARAEAKVGRPSKRAPVERPTAARIRKAEALRGRIPF